MGHRPASRGSFREEVLEILRPIVNRDGGLVHWSVRQIEFVRRERLVNERANSSTGDRLKSGLGATSLLLIQFHPPKRMGRMVSARDPSAPAIRLVLSLNKLGVAGRTATVPVRAGSNVGPGDEHA